jgi:putative pre-16S rRNA nuclease
MNIGAEEGIAAWTARRPPCGGRLHGRILAIDFGTRRIGLAVSDPLGLTAQGIETLERTRMEDDLRHIQNLVDEYSAERVLIGNPISHKGTETAMSERVAAFAKKLRRRVACPVELADERLTSAQANRVLRDSGISLQKRRGAVDRMAAVLLLQAYLDHRSNEAERRLRSSGADPSAGAGS